MADSPTATTCSCWDGWNPKCPRHGRTHREQTTPNLHDLQDRLGAVCWEGVQCHDRLLSTKVLNLLRSMTPAEVAVLCAWPDQADNGSDGVARG